MSNIAKLKKKAAEFEQKKQFDKALALYVQILDGSDADEDVDVALFNRVGDLMFRQGDVAQALDYYEKAVDHYAESGFFNNAIALCNKILRQSPGRTSIYYKLGKISAHKGFKSDAKQNFLEYADRMQKAGQMDEAFRALKEFADLCPDQDDIRLMLAEQLSRRDRKGEALEQLQTLYDKFSAEGRQAEARATVDRMKAIDPSLQPRALGAQPAPNAGGLVFLDVSWEQGGAAGPSSGPPPAPAAPAPTRRAPTPPRPAPARSAPPSLIADLPLIVTNPAGSPAVPTAPGGPPSPGAGRTTGVGGERVDGPAERGAAVAGLELTALESTPLSGSEFGALPLRASAEQRAVVPRHDLALPGELPPLDIIGSDPLGSPGLDFDFSMPGERELDFGGAAGVVAPEVGSFASSFGDEGAGAGDSPEGGDLPLLDFGTDVPASGLESATLEFLGQADESPGAAPAIADGLVYLDAGPGAGADAGRVVDGLPLLEALPGPAGGDAVADPAPGDAAFLAMMSNSAADLAARAPAPADSLDALRLRVHQQQGDWGLRRRYAEALLESGDRDAGMHELELAMIGFERADDLEAARSVADEITRINPSSVRHHQKRVEYAFRTNDKPRLCDAYLQLADALFRTGQAEKSRSVYKRVLELNPDDMRAQAALSAFVDAEEPAPADVTRAVGGGERRPPAAGGAPRPSAPRAAAPSSGGGFVNLGELLRDDAAPRSTRMIVAEEEPTGDEQADFAEMLRKFKQGVAENVDDDDHESHYDLGVAYKEMGLVDEAIGEFQKALRAPDRRVRTYEALGQCFMEKRQLPVAASVLERALAEPGAGDDQLVGVLYLLGYACEALQRRDEALAHYHRVFAVDIQFRDVADRLAALERVTQ